MRLRVCLLAVVSGVIVAVAPAAAEAKICGRTYVPARQLKAKVRVVAGPDSCGAANQLIAAAFKAETTHHWNRTNPTRGVIWTVSGWNCGIGLGGSQTFCTRGRREVDGSFRTDDGWTF